MGQASPDWIADRRAAEHEFLERFADLEAVLLRVDGYIRRADEAAAALAKLPNANPADRQREAADLRRVALIAAHHLANLDRVHLIEEPSRIVRSNGRTAGARR
ncbi:hypothetical protein [Methylobacterium sp. Leaf466]|uniref:hypothetical protein n=1 Tax=Methylobacterium sp. Leaf466 TaxID=1736386 RepID=UPI0006FB9E98|nr:hypothetical protein [Methylobacterium sp. Leaf466]KQT88908.1 hypothetical protein ASG59_13635 [Methylobacterium sp. Leaf466]